MELFKLLGIISVNNSEAISGINEAVDVANDASSKFGNFLDDMGELAKKTAIAVGTVFTAAATGVVALTKSAVSGYAEYEQLVGGAELMFGDAYDFVAEKAANAYATVQMSQSEYLQQVNGFATGLKTSLNGDAMAAAELADRIVVAEADIVAATGASSESVQNAFNGIMKSNFTMVDNLQLGIKPTKEGFQEMMNSVNEYNKAHGKMTNYTIDNLADCQNALVDYVAMQGMANYAMNEGSTTISGSIATMQSAWKNLVTGLSDPNADLGVLVENMVVSAKNALTTIKPAVFNALSGLSELISEVAPIVAAELPALVEELLPSILSAATDLINGAMTALPIILTVLSEQLPTIISQILLTMETIGPDLIVGVVSIISAIASALTEPQNLKLILDAIGKVGSALIENFLQPENIEAFIEKCAELCEAIGQEFIDNGPAIAEKFMEVVAGIFTALSESQVDIDILEWFGGLSVGIIQILSTLAGNSEEETDRLIQTLGEMGIALAQFGADMKRRLDLGWDGFKRTNQQMWAWITSGWEAVSGGFQQVIDWIVMGWDGIKGGLQQVWDWIVMGWQGVLDTIDDVKNGISEKIDDLIALFDFDWSFPDIKLPHFSVSGGKAPWGLGGQGSLPTISVEYYAKGGVLDAATIFGQNGNNLMIGGEAGREAIIPLEKDTRGIELIAQTLQNNMDQGGNLMIQQQLNDIIVSLEKLSKMNITLDTGTVVGELAPKMNGALGEIYSASDRGGRTAWA